MDVWVAPILNRLKGIKTKNDEILSGVNEVKSKQDGLQDVVAKESTLLNCTASINANNIFYSLDVNLNHNILSYKSQYTKTYNDASHFCLKLVDFIAEANGTLLCSISTTASKNARDLYVDAYCNNKDLITVANETEVDNTLLVDSVGGVRNFHDSTVSTKTALVKLEVTRGKYYTFVLHDGAYSKGYTTNLQGVTIDIYADRR